MTLAYGETISGTSVIIVENDEQYEADIAEAAHIERDELPLANNHGRRCKTRVPYQYENDI